MAVDESNQTQADFWTAAGPLWTQLRERFDGQASAHGLAAIDALAPAVGESVIDIGCGAGTSTVQLAERVGSSGSVLGLDISPTMIEGAAALAEQNGLDQISFTVGDAMVEAFDGSADAAYSRFGLMFFSDATAGFSNIRTALRPGGRLGFVCWQSPQDNPWASVPLGVAARHIDIPFGADPTAPGPFSLGDPDRLQGILDGAGFVESEIAPRTAPANMGDTMDEAVEFVFNLMPAAAALRNEDPDAADALRADLADELRQYDGPNGVESPSAVWIVTATAPS